MNKQQIIDEAHKNYLKQTIFVGDQHWYEPITVFNVRTLVESIGYRQYHKDGFINKCKTDNEFSEKWGLKIEERELSLDERCEFDSKQENVRNTYGQAIITFGPKEVKRWLNEKNVPIKLITITYNNKTIESYEN